MAIYYPTEGPYIVYIAISFLFEKFLKYIYYFMCMCALECMHVNYMSAVPTEAREGWVP
jgi:hypothetical protein